MRKIFTFSKETLIARSGLPLAYAAHFYPSGFITHCNMYLCMRSNYSNQFDAVPAVHNVLTVVNSETTKIIRYSACGAKRMIFLF